MYDPPSVNVLLHLYPCKMFYSTFSGLCKVYYMLEIFLIYCRTGKVVNIVVLTEVEVEALEEVVRRLSVVGDVVEEEEVV